MQRILILAGGAGLMISLYYGTSAESEKKIPEQTVESHLIEETLIHEMAGNVVPERDYLLWTKVSDEAELQWENEILTHIRSIDRENSDLLYQYYRSERRDYLKTQDRTMAQSLNEGDVASPEMRHDEFSMKLKKIFRKQYRYIEDQRKSFRDSWETKR